MAIFLVRENSNHVHIDQCTKFDLVNWTLSPHAHMILFSLIKY